VTITHAQAEQAWTSVQTELALKLTPEEFEVYVGGSSLFACEDGELLVRVPHALALTFLNDKYRSTVKRSLSRALGQAIQINFFVGSPPAENTETLTPLEALSRQPAESETAASRSFHTSTKLNPYFTFDQFVRGEHNQLAWAAARSLAGSSVNPYMPLYIYGAVGLGKTHLLHAVGHEVQAAGARIALCTTEQFLNDLVASIRTQQMDRFRSRYRDVDLLLLDDVQFLGGRERTQEEFFFTFTELFEQGKRVVLTSDCPPKSIQGLEQRLISRFEGGHTVDINHPEYESRLAILQQKVHLYQYDIPMPLLQPIAQHIRDNVRVLEGVLHQLNLLRSQHQAPLTEQQVMACLGGMAPPEQDWDPESVLETIAAFFALDLEGLRGPSRKKVLAHARQIAMYLLRHDGQVSMPKIGALLGGRDPKTVRHGVARIAVQLTEDHKLASELAEIRRQLSIAV